jgi:hypothetical protein
MSYDEWIATLKSSPFGAGWNGCLFVLSLLVVTLAGAYFGIVIFPEGKYPQILLALPGLLVGCFYFYVAGPFLYRLGAPSAPTQEQTTVLPR